MEKRRITFKEILCLLVLLALAAGAYFWSLMQPDGGTVVIEQDGVTDYGNSNYGDTNYGNSNYGDSNYDDGGSDYSDGDSGYDD